MEVEQIIKLMEALSRNGLTELSLEENGTILKLKKSSPKTSAVPAAATGAAPVAAMESDTFVPQEASAMDGKCMTCPLVGTFYAAPSPDAEPFVKVGDTVKKGQVLGIVEAMKLMNEIESEYDGVVKAILVENGDLIEYGQDMFIIE